MTILLEQGENQFRDGMENLIFNVHLKTCLSQHVKITQKVLLTIYKVLDLFTVN